MLLLAIAGLGGACAKRAGSGGTAATPSPPPRIEPLQLIREDLSDAQQQKLHIRLRVEATANREQIDDLIRRVAAAEQSAGGALWISVFLDGMDLNSVAYALGIVQPGGPLAITYRESLQTYR
jgi:hypothetical protein